MKSKLAGCAIDFSPSFQLKLKEQIGTGSFSDVYSTNDPRYVIKMINSSDSKCLISYNNEKTAFLSIPKHQTIINCLTFRDSIYLKGTIYCCLVLENCPRGSIISIVVDKKAIFEENQILQIFLDVLLGLHQMHNISQPIAHRDLKGENILLGEDGRFKISDFGSISLTRIFEINAENRDLIEKDIQKNTTPTIRAPEQCDLYSGFPINEKVDIWALGCLLFILCFQKQPFETRLATINCHYFINEKPKYSKAMLDLFPLLFTADPRKRSNTSSLLSYFEANFYSLPKSILEKPKDNTVGQTQSVKKKEGRRRKIFGDLKQTVLPPELAMSYNCWKNNSLFDLGLNKNVKKLPKKIEDLVLAALDENKDLIDQRSFNYLIAKAWKKAEKIKKFYVIFHKRVTKYQESTIVTLKGLLILHNYLLKGPAGVLIEGTNTNISYPKDMLLSIHEMWKIRFSSNIQNSTDKARDLYVSNLIIEYSNLLTLKSNLIRQYGGTFEGNFALKPFLDKQAGCINPFQDLIIQDFINYLQKVIDFYKIILIRRNLRPIQVGIASTLLEEGYHLISTLTYLLIGFKKIKADYEKFLESSKKLEESFLFYYKELFSIFDTSKEINDNIRPIYDLPTPEKLESEIQTLDTKNIENQDHEYDAEKYLADHSVICGLKVPLSYKTSFETMNFDQINVGEPRVFTLISNGDLLNIIDKSSPTFPIEIENQIYSPITEPNLKIQSVQENTQNLQKEIDDTKCHLDHFEKYLQPTTPELPKTSILQSRDLNQIEGLENIDFNFGSDKSAEIKDIRLIKTPEPWPVYNNIKVYKFPKLEIFGPDQYLKEKYTENAEKIVERHCDDMTIQKPNPDKITETTFQSQKSQESLKDIITPQQILETQTSKPTENFLEQTSELKADKTFEKSIITETHPLQQTEQDNFLKDSNNLTTVMLCDRLEVDVENSKEHHGSEITSKEIENKQEVIEQNSVVLKQEEKIKEEPHAETTEFTFEIFIDHYNKRQPKMIEKNNKQNTKTSKVDWDNIFRLKNDNPQSTNFENNPATSQSSISMSYIYSPCLLDDTKKSLPEWIINYSDLKLGEETISKESSQISKGLLGDKEVGVKKISLDLLTNNKKNELEGDITAYMNLKPQNNLINLLGMSLYKSDVYILTEICYGGTLFEWLHVRKSFNLSWSQKIKIALDIACALNHLHLSNISLNKDLNPLNLLVNAPIRSDSQDFEIKLAFSEVINIGNITQDLRTGLKSLYHWTAPEVYYNKAYTIEACVYSFGILLWEIATREIPYSELKTLMAVVNHVSIQKKRPDLSKIPANCPKEIIELILKCWAHEPRARPKTSEILQILKSLKL